MGGVLNIAMSEKLLTPLLDMSDWHSYGSRMRSVLFSQGAAPRSVSPGHSLKAMDTASSVHCSSSTPSEVWELTSTLHAETGLPGGPGGWSPWGLCSLGRMKLAEQP